MDLETTLDMNVISWTSSVLLTKSGNVLTRLGSQSNLPFNTNLGVNSSSVINRHVVGYPLHSRWAYEIVGYSDRNSDNILDRDEVTLSDSVTYLGAPFPKYELNLNQQVNLLARFVITAGLNYSHGTNQEMKRRVQYNRYDYDPNLSLKEQAYGLYSAHAYVQNVSSLRWNSLQVSYILPVEISRRIVGNHSVSVAAFGSNISLWTNYRGKDPNVGAAGETIRDNGELPKPKSVGFQVRIQ